MDFQSVVRNVRSVKGGERDGVVDEKGKASSTVRGGTVTSMEGVVGERDVGGGGLEFRLLDGCDFYGVCLEEVEEFKSTTAQSVSVEL